MTREQIIKQLESQLEQANQFYVTHGDTCANDPWCADCLEVAVHVEELEEQLNHHKDLLEMGL